MELENKKFSNKMVVIQLLNDNHMTSYHDYYQKLKFQTYYDTNLMCSLANILFLCIDVPDITCCKKRYSD